MAVDKKLNNELEYISCSIHKTLGIKHSKPAVLRFLIQHYNASKDMIKVKKGRRSFEFI